MSSEWMDKAKAMANKAADEAKKLAESAKNANYSEMFDKTKNMAMQAAEEAKKAAQNVMAKDKAASAVNDLDTSTVDQTKIIEMCNQRLAKAETTLQEVKDLLSKVVTKS